MSKQLFLFTLICCSFPASNAMNRPIDTQQPGNRFSQWKNYCLEKSELQQKEWLQGYHSHLQQKPVPIVGDKKKDIPTPK